MTAPIRDWRYDVELPDGGWVWLPGAGETVAGWAGEVCAALQVGGAAAVALADHLRTFATRLREQAPDLGALWLPDPTAGVLATLRIDRYKLSRSLEELAGDERGAAQRGLAPPEVDLVALPAGPALRVRRVARERRASHGDLLVESVRHLVAPPGVVDADGDPTAVELLVAWTYLAEGDEFADMADSAAGLLAVTTG
ncbi:hypothetical protein [Blastococcus xanthinilyticus]|uniref:Uncharacterized protein n=1 Tax=Blastococcus xanthinilyticus TaxID=1564164 RepID=A0A5S5CNE5_9ACTN|nr:hypothetical protein [Blastococcus xanthinilyticus]TYP83649.1 hypothetical protein BD833_1167 [Blastococcus xanthinilyticus]